ncbi:hypothetical protein ACIQGZ_08710 [Streptomyces sp. NPDC092296]|uniref:hypothetical protein n=1 Tax=Streptomyces sp. NPDC092296 TaxID=3366012 RepID=UPI0037FC1B18
MSGRLLGGLEAGLSPDQAHRLTETVLRVRPLGRAVADARFTLAMDRRVREEYEKVLRPRLAPDDRPEES